MGSLVHLVRTHQMDQVGEINWSKVEHSNHYGPKQKVLHCIVRGCASLWPWRECIRFLVDVCLWIVYMELLLEHVQSWQALQGLKMVKVCLLELVSGYWGSFLCLVPISKDNNGGLVELDCKAFLDCFYRFGHGRAPPSFRWRVISTTL